MKYYYNFLLNKYFDRFSIRQMFCLNLFFFFIMYAMAMDSTESFLGKHLDYQLIFKLNVAIFSGWVCAFVYYTLHVQPFWGTWLCLTSSGKGNRSVHMGWLATIIFCTILPDGYLVKGARKLLKTVGGSGFDGQLTISTYLFSNANQTMALINRLRREFPHWQVDFGKPGRLGLFSVLHLRILLWIRRKVKGKKALGRRPIAGKYFYTIQIKCNQVEHSR